MHCLHCHASPSNPKASKVRQAPRRTRARFAEHLSTFYAKPVFWHRAYYVGSVGGATLETVRAYVDAQGTVEHARKSEAKKRKPPA
ncbi:transposase [Thiomonas sp. FB-Cd]|uniref:transposase n=1 Tax=Thiomonas sp. FB-Cd TaxID=1158292 RepID=UPI000AD271A4|nr:transposase [Thiomonas sp. FB-Cd]